MLATYHNHSTWSDGKASLDEIVHAARRMNIGELGISDHWVLHPRGKTFKWAMPVERLEAYMAQLTTLRESAARSLQVRIGLEVDWFAGHGDVLREALAPYAFDYIIGSVHQVEVTGLGEFVIDMSPASWQKLSEDQRNDLHRQYWSNIKSMAESGLFDIVAHIDLPKKFGFAATIDLSREIGAALDAIAAAANRPVVELNTAGWHKPCNDAYPSVEILRECRRREIQVTLGADAHQAEHLLRDFGRGAQRLGEAGFTHVARFEKRRVRLEPLAEAVPAEVGQ